MDGHIQSVHQKIKHLKCKYCGSTFAKSGTLKIHVAAIHERENSYKCEIFTTSFPIQSILNRHILQNHNEKGERSITVPFAKLHTLLEVVWSVILNLFMIK